jgi:hypothetical protein
VSCFLRTLLLAAVILSLAGASLAAPPKPRPFAGIGLVLLRPISPVRRADIARVILYREPGVGRIGEFATDKLPGLAPVLVPAAGEIAAAAMGKKGTWLRVAYDDAGQEGWVEQARPWIYVPWERYLAGRSVRLLPGLRKELYLSRSEPSLRGRALAAVTAQQPLRVLRVEEEWALVTLPAGPSVWLRWHDEDGRFTIAVEGATAPESR